ncbi:uncharacterized protein TNCV_4190411 [Trichonephila clavipes]|nr:uncharacterized protein TNCV_4190411 [Trichonephila clavipes]
MAPQYHQTSCGVVCRCKAKARLRRSPRERGGLHTNTIVITCDGLTRLFFNMSFGFFGPELMATLFQPNPRSEFHSAAVQFPRVWHHSKWRRRWLGVKGSTRNGRRNPKSPSVRRLHMVREDTGAPTEGATCA